MLPFRVTFTFFGLPVQCLILGLGTKSLLSLLLIRSIWGTFFVTFFGDHGVYFWGWGQVQTHFGPANVDYQFCFISTGLSFCFNSTTLEASFALLGPSGLFFGLWSLLINIRFMSNPSKLYSTSFYYYS